MTDNTLKAGVIGVGRMGRHHARLYKELSETELVGVYDAKYERAKEVAEKNNVNPLSKKELLEASDLVSIVVPTKFHAPVAFDCFDAGVHTLIEKPVAPTVEIAEKIAQAASSTDVCVQIGHVERFNPATQTLLNIVGDLQVLAVSAERLGPPIERDIDDSVVLDLMIHDLDVLLSLTGESPSSVDARGVEAGEYATATVTFDNNTIGRLTASRITQQKIRKLVVTARECVVEVDYIDQSVEIHYDSIPEYIERNGRVRYRHESVIERPVVENGEPLKNELEAFVSAVRNNREPPVPIEDGIKALNLASKIDSLAFNDSGTIEQ